MTGFFNLKLKYFGQDFYTGWAAFNLSGVDFIYLFTTSESSRAVINQEHFYILVLVWELRIKSRVAPWKLHKPI